jgi:hypothetical protein
MFTTLRGLVLTSGAEAKLLVPSFGVVMPRECKVQARGGCPSVPPEVCGPDFAERNLKVDRKLPEKSPGSKPITRGAEHG